MYLQMRKSIWLFDYLITWLEHIRGKTKLFRSGFILAYTICFLVYIFLNR